MAKESILVGAAAGEAPKTPSTKATGNVVKDGEPGYAKRSSHDSRLDTVVRVTGGRYQKPTK